MMNSGKYSRDRDER